MSEAPDLDALSFKGRSGLTRILNATGYSLAGLLDVSRVERVLLMLTPLLALVVELLNSAIEAVVDRISLNLHPLSKQAKDMGSAAQLLALLIIALTWALILL